jgi:hypothetical protein
MKINFERAVSYVDTLYENDEASNKIFISVEYPAACCGDGKLSREMLLNNRFIFLVLFVL